MVAAGIAKFLLLECISFETVNLSTMNKFVVAVLLVAFTAAIVANATPLDDYIALPDPYFCKLGGYNNQYDAYFKFSMGDR